MDYRNKILCGNDLEILPKLPAESVNCVICSPPYWGLRDYGIEPVIWDGDKEFYSESLKRYIPRNCKHDFGEYDSKLLHENRQNLNGGTLGNPQYRKNLHGLGNAKAGFCSKCGAWRGSLGLEPTFELYIKHLCDIFDEVKRVLRKDGTCFVNIGDSYGGSGNASGHNKDTKNLGYKTSEMGATQGNQKSTGQYAKSLLDIPYRFSIEMTNRGWIKRNTIIWFKKNCMPSSADDRFTIDFEYLFFFTKNNKAIFWTNEKTLECVGKKPSGTKGIEGKDWEWKKVGAVNESSPNQRVRDIEKGALQKATEEEIKNYGKTKWKKMSLWTGYDYWFEQQFDKYAPSTLPRMERGVNFNKWTFGADGQTPHNLSQPRSNKKRGYKTKQPEEEIHRPQHHGKDISYGKQGRNKRCVWTIPTQSFPEAHFAVYPEGLIEIPIKAGCPEFVCKKCGKARVKIYDSRKNYHYLRTDTGKFRNKALIDKKGKSALQSGKDYGKRYKEGYVREYQFKGYTDCHCNAGFESGIVLDPFMGAGTTALVALKQRKRFVGIEIKESYIDMAKRRIAKVQQRIF